jgi:hypothetical protein
MQVANGLQVVSAVQSTVSAVRAQLFSEAAACSRQDVQAAPASPAPASAQVVDSHAL